MNRSILLCALLSLAAHAGSGQQVKVPKTAGFGIGYLEYLPQDYDDRPTANFPVLIFFHGIGENGHGTDTDLDRVLNNSGGPPTFIRDGAHFPFIVISGQHNADPNTSCWYTSEIDALIEHVKTTYRVDANRIYLTGLSCGAIGLWNFLNDPLLNGKPAAALPISGSGGSFSNTDRLDVPVWSFHGGTDGTVQACTDNGNAIALNGLTPPTVPAMRATFVPGQGHTGWTQVYGNTSPGCNVYEWLMRFDKSVPRTARNVAVDGGTVGDPAVALNGAPNSTWCNTTSRAPTPTWNNTSAGSCIIVTAAAAPTGMVFDHWDTGGVAVDVPASAIANFVMPDQSLTLSPVYRAVGQAYVDTIAPKLWLTTPSSASAYSTSLASLTLAGTAIDDVGVTQVAWVNSAGGSGNATLASGTTTMRAFRAAIALSAGTNTVTFTARDAAAHTTTTVVTINRGAIVNMPPVVDAGPMATVTLPAGVTLQGTASDDGLPGTGLTLTWTRASGPGTVTFGNAASATSTATFSAAGTYVLRLTANDGALPASDTVTIVVSAPTFSLTVVGGSGSGTYAAGAMITLTASAPPAGQTFTQWTATAGTLAMATTASTTFTMPSSAATVTANFATVPTFALTVVNGSGTGTYAAGATVTLTANAPAAGQVFTQWTTTAGTLAMATSPSTTFTMPAGAVTVTANYAAGQAFVLTVVNGTGSGSYAAATPIALQADAAPTGQIFDRWVATAGTLAVATDAATTFTMPSADATITATYRAVTTFSLTVIDGSGGGSFAPGAAIAITANTPPSGQQFGRWSGNVTFVDATAASTTLTMPANDVTVTAQFVAASPTVTGFSLLESDGSVIAEFDPLSDGAEVKQARHVSVRANTNAVASVQFTLDGEVTPLQLAPFVLPGELAVGTHLISATGYAETDGTGVSSALSTISLHVIDDSPSSELPGVSGVACSCQSGPLSVLAWAALALFSRRRRNLSLRSGERSVRSTG